VTVVLRAGEASLADWRAIWGGDSITVDPSSRAGVVASAAAVAGYLVVQSKPVRVSSRTLPRSTRRHAAAVEFDFVHSLVAAGALSASLES